MLINNYIPKKIGNSPLATEVYSVTQEPAHYHEGFLEIVYCLKGIVTAHILHEDIILEPGDIISMDPHDIHFLYSSDDNLLVSFYFDLNDKRFDHPQLPDIFFVCEKYVLWEPKRKKQKEIKILLLTILYLYSFSEDLSDAENDFLYLSKQIIQIMLDNFHIFDYSIGEIEYSAEMKKRFEKVILYINSHYKDRLTVAQISRQEFLNSNYLSHFFKKTCFLGFSNYVNYIRVYHSDLQLLETNHNIAEISYNVGFSDVKFFYEHFRKWYGHTPNQHRKKYKEYMKTAKKNTYYNPRFIKHELEHFISFYFVSLQLHSTTSHKYTPFNNVPF